MTTYSEVLGAIKHLRNLDEFQYTLEQGNKQG